jgi:3-hydroxyisobutyrate dehydrogenase
MFSTLPRLARSNSISFIGLGRMGSQMAINLFSKSFAADPTSRFVVCDAVPQSVLSFKTEFERSVKGAGERLKIVNTPRE